jgi:hypothetical protein
LIHSVNLQEEWQAAKAFYRNWAVIDARIILNHEPIGDCVEGLHSPEEFFAWAQRNSSDAVEAFHAIL